MKHITNLDDFIIEIQKLKSVTSVTGITYSLREVTKEKIIGIRESTYNDFVINTRELFDAYLKTDINTVNTTELRLYIGGRVYSPSLAILKCLD